MDYRSRKDQVERAMDELLALYGERHRVEQIRAASLQRWERERRAVRMRLFLGLFLVLGAFASAGAGAILQAPTVPARPWWLDWFQPTMALVSVVGLIIVIRETVKRNTLEIERNRMEIEKKVDEKVFQTEVRALYAKIDDTAKAFMGAVESMRGEFRAAVGDVRDDIAELRRERNQRRSGDAS